MSMKLFHHDTIAPTTRAPKAKAGLNPVDNALPVLLDLGPEPVAVLVPELEPDHEGDPELDEGEEDWEDGVLIVAVVAASWNAASCDPAFTPRTMPELQSLLANE